jgi:hypothetical protein
MQSLLGLEVERRWASFLARARVRRARAAVRLHRRAALAVALTLGILFMVLHWK